MNTCCVHIRNHRVAFIFISDKMKIGGFMDTRKQLTIGMALLFIFVISFYGIIIVNIKSKEFLLPKAEKKINEHIKDNYSDIKNDIKINKTKYNNIKKRYETKVISKENKNLYFMVYYKNKKFSNTYKNDYIKGNSILSFYKNKFLKKLSNSKKYTDTSISFTKDLDKYSSVIKDTIIKDDNVNLLSIYAVKSDIIVNNFNKNTIIDIVNKYYKFIESNNLRPKYYSVVLINKEDITKSLEINNLTSELIINNLDEIVDSIINKDKKIIYKYKINYKYID